MDNHRQSQRQLITEKRECDLDVITFKQLDRTGHHGHIVDISRTGIGIESNTPMEPGLVWFKDRIWGQQSGVMLWSKQVGTQYRSGIRFATLPSDAEPGTQERLAQSGIHEPLKDLEQLVAMQLESIKKRPTPGTE
jgi:hypothetical protein